MTKAGANLLTLVVSILIALGAAEILLRFLPVNTGLAALPVNAQSPVFRFTPDREFVWSKGGLFDLVNRGRVNKDGFVNDQDYRADGPPLLAVIGDSYVEAAMVPYQETLQGRLAAGLGARARVYSFGASGAPLSQYLIWAEYARQTYRPQRMVFVVVGNDFDESLLAYKQAPGFHYYAEDADQRLTLARIDYAPDLWRPLLRASALLRYLRLNLMIESLARRPFAAPIDEGATFGHTAARASPKRLEDARRAIEAFLRDLPRHAGLEPERILFLVDGFRYPAPSPEMAARQKASFFHQARQTFLAAARAKGHAAIDLDDYFLKEFSHTGQRFDFPTDGHWNGLGHAVAAKAIGQSGLLAPYTTP